MADTMAKDLISLHFLDVVANNFALPCCRYIHHHDCLQRSHLGIHRKEAVHDVGG